MQFSILETIEHAQVAFDWARCEVAAVRHWEMQSTGTSDHQSRTPAKGLPLGISKNAKSFAEVWTLTGP